MTVDRFEAWKMGRLYKVVFLSPHFKLEALKHELFYEGLDLVGIVAAERLV